jgi:spermidine/putrescine transport system ATP-binding protein
MSVQQVSPGTASNRAESNQAESSQEAQGSVEVRNITKRFGAMTAVDNVSIKIHAGEFVALLGPSGCGKTTTLRMLAGFEQPDTGQVFISGQEVAGIPAYKRDVNTVFQNYSLFPHMTVLDNVAFGPRSRGVDKATARTQAQDMLNVVRLGEFASRKPAQMSGGQQQRVALARALVNKPSALLLDEPLAALDLKLREAMQIELKRIQREVGITFIFVTHDQGEALTMSDRIVVMSQGRVEQIGTPEDIYYRPASIFVASFIGSANLLPAMVTGVGAETVSVKTSGGAVVHGSLDGRNFTVGQAATVMIRPERMIIEDDPIAEQANLAAVVTNRIFHGASSDVHVKTLDGTELVADLEADDGFVSWPNGSAYVLPETSTFAGNTVSDLENVEASL